MDSQTYIKQRSQTDPQFAAQVAAQQGAMTPQEEDPFAVMQKYRPDFISPLTAGGQFRPGMELNPTQLKSSMGGLEERLGGINLDKRGLEAYRSRALAAPGTSAWEQMQLARQGTEQAGQRDLASAQQAQGLAQARSQMAMKGGLSGGAGERLAASGAKQRMLSGQDIARQGIQARQGIGIEGENQRLGALQNLPGMEIQSLQPEMQKTSMWADMSSKENMFNAEQQANADRFNLQNKLGAMNAQNMQGQNVYGEQMKAWGAGKQAKAIEAQGKK